jgi:hypothetical protein
MVWLIAVCAVSIIFNIKIKYNNLKKYNVLFSITGITSIVTVSPSIRQREFPALFGNDISSIIISDCKLVNISVRNENCILFAYHHFDNHKSIFLRLCLNNIFCRTFNSAPAIFKRFGVLFIRKYRNTTYRTQNWERSIINLFGFSFGITASSIWIFSVN